MDLSIPARTRLSVSIYGQELKLTKPTIGQMEAFEAKKKTAGEDKQFQIMLDFLKELGLPENLGKDLELEHFTQIVELLAGKKK